MITILWGEPEEWQSVTYLKLSSGVVYEIDMTARGVMMPTFSLKMVVTQIFFKVGQCSFKKAWRKRTRDVKILPRDFERVIIIKQSW